jgi:hypothetical protein
MPCARTALLVVVCCIRALSQSVPRVHLVYTEPDGSAFDLACSGFLKASVDPDEHKRNIAETVRRLPDLQRLWDTDGVLYLKTAMEEVGLPYPYGEVQANVTACPGLPLGLSTPLLIRVLPFLSTATARQPDWHFSVLLFHELMHTYILPVRSRSELRGKKYASEDFGVRVHLHVLALEKFVLTKLGREQFLREIDHRYRNIAAPAYRRAWEIVSVEGYEPFIRELKQASQSR